MRTEHRVAEPAGFIDGDLLQRFHARLSPAQRNAVVRGSRDPGVVTDFDEGEDDGTAVELSPDDVASITRLIESCVRM